MNPHARYPISFAELFASLWRNRGLIWQLTRREVVGRYRGSVLGILWSFFNPVLMLSVYTFVFSVVFKARWGIGGDDSAATFALALFVGLIVHGLFAEVANRAPGLILGNVSYVKRVVFPLEVLPWVATGSALFHAGVSLLVLLVAQFVVVQQLPWTVVLLPIVAAPLILVSMGVAWFLASFGVYVRDVAQTTGIVTTVLLFLSPVFFPVSALPERLQVWMYLNPLTFVMEEARNVLLFGRLPDWRGNGLFLAIGLGIAWAGFAWFQKTRKGFADVV